MTNPAHHASDTSIVPPMLVATTDVPRYGQMSLVLAGGGVASG